MRKDWQPYLPVHLPQWHNCPLCGGQMQTAAEEQAQPASSDTAMLDRCKHVKIHFVTGDIHKLLLRRSKYGSLFSAITVGHRHAHFLEKQHALAGVAAPGALLAVETAKYMLQLASKQVSGTPPAIRA